MLATTVVRMHLQRYAVHTTLNTCRLLTAAACGLRHRSGAGGLPAHGTSAERLEPHAAAQQRCSERPPHRNVHGRGQRLPEKVRSTLPSNIARLYYAQQRPVTAEHRAQHPQYPFFPRPAVFQVAWHEQQASPWQSPTSPSDLALSHRLGDASHLPRRLSDIETDGQAARRLLQGGASASLNPDLACQGCPTTDIRVQARSYRAMCLASGII